MKPEPPDPTIHELRALAVLDQTPNLQQAALELGIAAAELTRLVRRAERSLGVDLLEGSARRLTLTPTGAAAAKAAALAVPRIDAFHMVVGSAHGGRADTLVIGCAPVHVAAALAYLASYHETVHPNVKVDVRQVVQDPGKAANLLYETVRQGVEHDIVMGGPSQNDLAHEHVYNAPMLFFPADDLKPPRGKLRLHQLVDHNIPVLVQTSGFFARLLLNKLAPGLNIVADSRSGVGLIAFRDVGKGSAIVSSDSLIGLETTSPALPLHDNQGHPLVTEVCLHFNPTKLKERLPLVEEFLRTVGVFKDAIRAEDTTRDARSVPVPKDYADAYRTLTERDVNPAGRESQKPGSR
ncbi:MAG: LysR family transcriptional regulator [Acidimicrobiales bacterium]